ncbi:MAG TPA: DegQ family serine endoprotease [Candidatus Sulfotelmatobacter sp.]|nr:DegQ family serine endoprotease [Candidatus Sulfotelmatobacter sp.]
MERRYTLRSLILVAIVSLVLGALAANTFSQGTAAQVTGPLWTEGTAKPRGGADPMGDPRIWVRLAKALRPAVVNISTTQQIQQGRHPSTPFRGPRGEDDPFQEFMRRFFGEGPSRPHQAQSLGSGFIIHPDGFIVTNNHVVENATDIRVKLEDGKEYKATVVGRDPKTDLALIKIDAKNLPVAPFGNSEKLEVGEPVMAIGNPFGLDATVTTGIISAKGRVIGEGPYDDFIQTDASINRGNSGGPLINTLGEVVAINTAIFSPTGGSVGIGFAIPINQAKTILPQLQAKGAVTRAWLGVSIQQVTPDLAKTLGLSDPRGALVADVVADSPAEKAGMKQYDVIVEFDGKAVKSSHDLPRLVAETPVGKNVTVKALREGKEITVRATLAVLDEERLASRGSGGAPSRAKLGMALQDITPEMAQTLGLKDPRGVVVTQIEPGSPADAAGLQVGDVILEVNRTKVQNLRETQQALEKTGPDRGTLLLVKRGDSQIFIAIKAG